MEKINSSKDNPTYINREEINLKDLFDFYFRNRILIGSFTLVFLLLSIIHSAFKKNIWEGHFQIVLDTKPVNQPPLNLLNNVNIPNFGGANSLATEVAILESPSVLMPAFDFIKDKKNQIKKDSFKSNFIGWKKNNLNVELKNGTSVLNISYQDEDKFIIQPVLKKISKIYQDYSGQTKKRKFALAEDYLNKQILLFKKKSYESIKKAQQYAIAQDLRIIDLNNSSKSKEIDEEYVSNFYRMSNIGIEDVRVSAANKIRNIDIQIEQIEGLKDDVKQLQYIGSTIPGLVKEGLPNILEGLEKELIESRSIYTDNDEIIKRLLKKRELYIKLFKERAIGYLRAEKMSTKALMISAMRPKDVLLNYKELMRDANRDENMLIELESQLKMLNLEMARTEDPWRLISKPTVLEGPVGPNRKLIILSGFIFGLASGSLSSLFKEQFQLSKS